MNKKGYDLIMVIFEVLVVASVVFMSLQVAKGYAESTTVDKVNTATDLALMVNTFVGTPGDSIVEYPKDVSQFSIVLSDGGVKVFVKGESEIKQASQTFYLPEKYSAEGITEEATKICLRKDGYVITLFECGVNG